VFEEIVAKGTGGLQTSFHIVTAVDLLDNVFIMGKLVFQAGSLGFIDR
jgi:hypothetical protein